MAKEETPKNDETPKKDSEIPFRNDAIAAIRGLVHENKKLRDTIAESAKKKKEKSTERKESFATKIKGLQTLKDTLGTPSKA